MRVLLVNDYAADDGYGAEAYLRRLAAGLAAAGDDVEVWAGQVHHTGIGRSRDLWDPAARRALRGAVEAHASDVVHLHNIVRECSGSVVGAARRLGVPTVVTLHDHRLLGIPDSAGGGVGARLHRVGARRSGALAARAVRRHAAATMAVSPALAAAAVRAGFPAVSEVGVPVDAPLVPPQPVAGCTDIAIVGRLSADKGVDVALAAFARIAGHHPDARLVLAGDGPLRDRVRAAARGLGDRVALPGRLGPEDVSRLLGSCRFVVALPVGSRRPEGAPTIVAEAAAHGRPVLVSDEPGVRAVATRLGGAVVTPVLDVDAVAAAMDGLLGDDQQVRTLGAAAHAAVGRHHGIAVVTGAVQEVYRRVTATGAPGPDGRGA